MFLYSIVLPDNDVISCIMSVCAVVKVAVKYVAGLGWEFGELSACLNGRRLFLRTMAWGSEDGASGAPWEVKNSGRSP